MTEQTKAVLKAYFETGDKPTQTQFTNLIDTLVTETSANARFETKTSAATLETSVSNLSATVSAITSDITGTGNYVKETSASITTPTITNPNIIGTTTNNDASSGSVGEFLSSYIYSTSAISITSGTGKTITSITLSAGDWDVAGVAGFIPSGTTNTTRVAASISRTNNTMLTEPYYGYTQINLASQLLTLHTILPVAIHRISVSAQTTCYIVGAATFTGGGTYVEYGGIWARRVR